MPFFLVVGEAEVVVVAGVVLAPAEAGGVPAGLADVAAVMVTFLPGNSWVL